MRKIPNLNIDTTIEIKCKDARESKAIYDSLFPDNINSPKNLEIDMEASRSSALLNLRFYLNVEKQNSIGTLLNTVDEILEHVKVIKNVIKND